MNDLVNGALLIRKASGLSSFGVLEILQRQMMAKKGLKKKDLPKMGHGGTLDPFATGLLVVLVGRGVKLARYFLGSQKEYEARLRFGETTIPGDPTGPISETSSVIPESIEVLRQLAHQMTLQPYLQIPPMYSAKKKDGKPLYELARQGIEVEREPKSCLLYEFQFKNYEKPTAQFSLKCSSGTYVRTLAQDFARQLGTVALLETLHRTSSGIFHVDQALSVEEIEQADLPWNELSCWVPFHRLLDGFKRAQATPEEQAALLQGKQKVLINILERVQPPTIPSPEKEDCLAIYCQQELIAVARHEQGLWGIERVFT